MDGLFAELSANGEIFIKDSETNDIKYIIPAPYMYSDDITADTLRTALDSLIKEREPDFIILDTSGGADISVELCARVSEQALIVTSRNPASVRAAVLQRCGGVFTETASILLKAAPPP